MKKKYIKKQAGFTLLELLITIAIIGILAAIAIPSYMDYTRKSYFSELVRATAPYKIAVSTCYQSLGTLTGCTASSNGVPAAISSQVGGIASLTVTNGVITVTPVAQNGLVSGDTYVLTPTATSSGIITWLASGGGVTKGYAPAS